MVKAIKTLSPPNPKARENLPVFMQTGAWGMEKMNSQLASWTELRHDNLLYAKQSYTGGNACEYPYGYVEPIPEFYKVMIKTAQIASDKFKVFKDISSDNDRVLSYFEHLDDVSNILLTIAEKELDGTTMSEEEMAFLQELGHTSWISSGNLIYNGWYPN